MKAVVYSLCCIGIMFFVVESVYSNGVGIPPPLYHVDSLDSRPEWIDSTFYVDVAGTFRWSGGWRLIDEDRRAQMWAGKPFRSWLRPGEFSTQKPRTFNESVHVLGWYATEKNYRAWFSPDPERIRTKFLRYALVWIKFEDTARKPYWGLMIISRVYEESPSDHTWNIPDPLFYLEPITGLQSSLIDEQIDSLDIRNRARKEVIPVTGEDHQVLLDSLRINNHRIRLYDHPPTNKDIYRFLRKAYEQEPDEESQPYFFNPLMLCRDAGEKFIEGGVRIKTWRNVTGENPEYNY